MELYSSSTTSGLLTVLAELSVPSDGPEPVRKDGSARQNQNRLPADQQAELLARYLAGESANDLARAYDVHRSTVARLIDDTNSRRPYRLSEDEVREAVELYARGWSCQQIGDHFGRSPGTIWHLLKRQGVERRSPQERPKPEAQ